MRAVSLCLLVCLMGVARCQVMRNVGRFQEVFAWKQVTFNIDGNLVLQDRFAEVEETQRQKRQSSHVVFDDNDEQERNWDRQPSSSRPSRPNSWSGPSSSTRRPENGGPSSSTRRPNNGDESQQFFIQYNNLPMGVERAGDRLFITLPRRRYGIPSTLNYIDLNRDSNTRSPALRPYPNLRQSRNIISVYRTRVDECNRLWMVDTGLLEIPDNQQQVQSPAIVVYDLNTDRQVLRYALKSTDIISPLSPTGLASITVDVSNGDCGNAFAYIPELTTFGLIVYSMRENDSWRLSHNYFSFNPTAGNLNIAGQRFQWSDGIFSVTLTEPRRDGCRTAYFHPMVSTQEFSVSTCVLKNRTASTDSNYWSFYSIVGDRGSDSQSTMHGYHAGSKVMFFADIGRDAISCWNTGTVLLPTSVEILAKDRMRMSYPSDLHVTGDEVWVMTNSLPRWGYSRLDTNEYNFHVYRANVQELISGTVCSGGRSYSMAVGSRQGEAEEE